MRILLVEDNPGDVRLLREYLAEAGAGRYEVTQAERLSAGLERLAEASFDAVLLDLSLPDSQGLATLIRVHAASTDMPIVVLTGTEDEDLGVQLVQAGAQDYLLKGQITAPLLVRSLRYAVERKQAEVKVRESEQRLRSLIESLQDVVVTLSKEGLITSLNQVFERLTHWSRDEWLRKPLVSLLHTDDLPFALDLVDHILTKGEPVRAAFRFRTKEGGSFVGEFTGVPQLKGSQVVGVVGIVRDITESKRAEEALRVSEGRFRSIMDNSPALIFLKDVEGRYLLVNRKFEEIFHLANGDLIGKTDEDIFPPERAAVFRANDRKVFEAGESIEFEEVACHDDGPHTSIVVKFPLVNPQGRCYALCGIVTDITDRKRAEEVLRLAKFSMDRAADAVYWIDPQAQVLDVNEAAVRMLGYSKDELCAMTVHDLNPEFQADMWPGFWKETRKRGTMVVETFHKAKNGRRIPIEVSVNFLAYKGKEYHCAFVRDITERKQAETQLQETLARLQNLSRREDVVREEERTRIARELHDELGVRLTCLKMDLARVSSLIPRHRIEEQVRAMTAEVDRTIASVQRLVTELRPGILDDLGLVAAIEWQCQDFAQRSGISCLCEASREEIPLDRSRATAAFRICQEALTNVLRHAEATAVTVRLDQRDGRLLLEIHDNGRGIAPDKRSGSQSFGLMGMRERAGAVGGQVHIAGEPGVGTTVTLDIPTANS